MIPSPPTHSYVNSKKNSVSPQLSDSPAQLRRSQLRGRKEEGDWVSSRPCGMRIADSCWAGKALVVNFYLKLWITYSLPYFLKGKSCLRISTWSIWKSCKKFTIQSARTDAHIHTWEVSSAQVELRACSKTLRKMIYFLFSWLIWVFGLFYFVFWWLSELF